MTTTTTTTPLDYASPIGLDAPARLDWRTLLSRLGPVIGLVFVYLLFTALSSMLAGSARFATLDNLQLMLRQTTVVGIAALGMTLIIISGGIDLSVGSNIALSTVMIAVVLNMVHGRNGTVPALAGVAIAALVGLAIGVMITWLRLSPFIVTLGMWGSVRGIAKAVGNNQAVYPDPPGAWRQTWLSGLLKDTGSIPKIVQIILLVWIIAVVVSVMVTLFGERRTAAVRTLAVVIAGPVAVVVTMILQRRWLIVPPGVWLLIVLAVLTSMMLRYTRFGRHIFAIGSNEQTARLCGIAIERTKLMIYLLAGALVGLAAVLDFSYVGIGDPTGRMGAELNVIAAVVIGGASLSGGEGTVFGSLVGALMMTMISNGCTKLGWPNQVEEIVTGAIIIAAAYLDRLRHRRAA